MEIEDDSDDVVQEIPVYLCKGLAKNLHLFQFPCKAADASLNTNDIVSSRVKPENGIIELDYKINTNDQFYDKVSGEEFGPENSNSKEKYKSGDKLLNKLTYQSQRSILKKDISCYSAATINDNKFYITPLHDAVSFLPTYNHTEKNKNLKAGAKDKSVDNSSSSENEAEEITAVPITVKFSQRSGDKSKVSQELNHQQYLTKIAEEPWYETKYFNNTSGKSVQTVKCLTNTVTKNNSALLSLSKKEYFDVLIPPDTTTSF